jgi:hypothetical protein
MREEFLFSLKKKLTKERGGLRAFEREEAEEQEEDTKEPRSSRAGEGCEGA